MPRRSEQRQHSRTRTRGTPPRAESMAVLRPLLATLARMSVPEKPSLDGLEAKWGEWWEATGTYRFDRSRAREQIYAIDTPPPTVSGSLHVGHALSYTHTDLDARFRRVRGLEGFYPCGSA